MLSDRMDYNTNLNELKTKCKKYLYYNVTLILADGSVFDGIIENVDEDRITMLIGEDVIDLDNSEDTNSENRKNNNVKDKSKHDNKRYRRYRRRYFPFGNILAFQLLPVIPNPFFIY